MKMIRIIIPILIITLCGCGGSLDKLKKTEEIVKKFDSKKDGTFFIEASIEGDKSELNVTLDHELFHAYYTGALYEIILELHKNHISYNHYTIKPLNGDILWEVDDTEISEITKTINHSKRLIQLLDDRKYDEFLTFSNFKALGISDSVFLANIVQNPIYPNSAYKGFSILEQEVNGENEEFMYIYFMNDELKENRIVLSPMDNLVYGLEY